ncbi:DUF3054 domain-containing protein [Phycicoccus endophyticus]|uniref:DUF3054 domain-containing protein n=1 Tax=Phycicoccus endophyticus TaxID=1690220 RepID=UPI0021D1C5D5|nr:DUF3054 domain-containing protein [Phycicoccus endophyticus]
MSRVLPAVLDALVVVVFAAVGRRSHSEGVDVLGVLRTAVPFLVGTAGGWVLAGLALDTGPRSLAWGAVVLVATVAVGMLVRAITGQGSPSPSSSSPPWCSACSCSGGGSSPGSFPGDPGSPVESLRRFYPPRLTCTNPAPRAPTDGARGPVRWRGGGAPRSVVRDRNVT